MRYERKTNLVNNPFNRLPDICAGHFNSAPLITLLTSAHPASILKALCRYGHQHINILVCLEWVYLKLGAGFCTFVWSSFKNWAAHPGDLSTNNSPSSTWLCTQTPLTKSCNELPLSYSAVYPERCNVLISAWCPVHVRIDMSNEYVREKIYTIIQFGEAIVWRVIKQSCIAVVCCHIFIFSICKYACSIIPSYMCWSLQSWVVTTSIGIYRGVQWSAMWCNVLHENKCTLMALYR